MANILEKEIIMIVPMVYENTQLPNHFPK